MDDQKNRTKIPLSELNILIQDLCESKVREFELIGYENVAANEIWDCVSEKYKHSHYPQIHQVANDILALKPSSFMDWLTLHALKDV